MFQSRRDGDEEIFVMRSDGSDAIQLTDNEVRDKVPTWSPDGGMIAFRSERDGNSEIYVMSSDGADQRRLTVLPESEQYRPHWSPDGRRISFHSSSRVAAEESDLYVINVDGSRQVLVDAAFGGVRSHDPWSPDGKRLAYYRGRDHLEVWVADLEDGSKAYLADGSAPAWSPDGASIALGCFLDDGWEICTIGPDGSGLERLTTSAGDDILPQWSADGSLIAFWSVVARVQELHVMNRDGTERRVLAELYGHTFAWNGAGTSIVFSARAGRDWEVFLVDVDGREPRRLTEDAYVDGWPSWRP